MKIGLFGGSFDPIHNGHLIITNLILDLFKLDTIYFIPNGNPPHKKIITNKFDRFIMTCLAIQDNKKFKISNIEFNEKIIYSCDTINYFKNILKNDEIFFIIGLDSLLEINTWKIGEKILDLCNFIIINRNNNINNKIIEKYKTKKNLFFYKDCDIKISSSMIRDLIKNNFSIKYLLPDKVINYIKENNLYKNDRYN